MPIATNKTACDLTEDDQLNGVITYYVYDGEKPILEYNNVYQLVAQNIYGKAIDEILIRKDYTVTPNVPFYYQDDHEGSVTHLTDGSGNVIESYRYDAFGAPTIRNAANSQIPSSNYGNRFMFTGREYAQKFGIYEWSEWGHHDMDGQAYEGSRRVERERTSQYRNRAYHPGLGRFTSEDPMGFAAGDNNLFRYCGNDPVDRVDPDGLMDMWTFSKAGYTRSYDGLRNEERERLDVGITMAPISAEVEGPKGRQRADDITINQLGKQLGATKDQTTTLVPGKNGPEVTEAATEVKTPRGGRGGALGSFGYSGAKEQFSLRSDALRIIHTHTRLKAAMPSTDDYAAVQGSKGVPMYFSSKYLARHGAAPDGTPGNYIILRYTGSRPWDLPRLEYRLDSRLTLPPQP